MTGKVRRTFLMTNSEPIEIPFIELKAGDLFSLMEPDGKPVYYQGSLKLEAMSDAFVNGNGIPEIMMKKYDPEVLR